MNAQLSITLKNENLKFDEIYESIKLELEVGIPFLIESLIIFDLIRCLGIKKAGI